MEEEFKAKGFRLLGFLSNDFGSQGGSVGDIDGCVDKYGVTFQQFAIDHVIDPDGAGPQKVQPVFDWLITQPNPGPAATPAPSWNFDKYLVSRDGKLVKHWDPVEYPGTDPTSATFKTHPIVVAIEAELAKP